MADGKRPRGKAKAKGEEHFAQEPGQRALQDAEIRRKLKKDPVDEDAELNAALDESMDASDPPTMTQPGGDEPAPSSGYPKKER
ncbi:MAG: hypothetical protein ACFBQW_00950 [Sphingomonadaceae bacterium]